VTVRAAEPGDAAAIADLVRLAFSTPLRPTVPPSGALHETADSVARHLDVDGGAVVEVGGAIVGAVLWHAKDDELYFGRLSIHPDHRRQGLARALIDEVAREARRRRLGWLRLGVRLNLEENRRLFRSCGFVDAGVHSHPGFTEPTWVLMERRIP
jgi:ribosomal protein S18 acetylase RimI-like enzyme